MVKIIFFISFLFCSITSFAFSIFVSPVVLKLDSKQQIISFSMTNKSDTKMTFQLSAVKWNKMNGIDSTTDTNDLIITPPIVSIPPGAEQVVRVGSRNHAIYPTEASYRILLRQLPGNSSNKYLDIKNFSTVKVLLSLSIPLFIAPVQEIKNINWDIKKISNNKLRLKLSNKGNVHVVISKLALQDASGSVYFSPEATGRVLSGQSQEWELSLKKPLTSKRITVKTTTDWDGKYRELSATVPVN